MKINIDNTFKRLKFLLIYYYIGILLTIIIRNILRNSNMGIEANTFLNFAITILILFKFISAFFICKIAQLVEKKISHYILLSIVVPFGLIFALIRLAKEYSKSKDKYIEIKEEIDFAEAYAQFQTKESLRFGRVGIALFFLIIGICILGKWWDENVNFIDKDTVFYAILSISVAVMILNFILRYTRKKRFTKEWQTKVNPNEINEILESNKKETYFTLKLALLIIPIGVILAIARTLTSVTHNYAQGKIVLFLSNIFVIITIILFIYFLIYVKRK